MTVVIKSNCDNDAIVELDNIADQSHMVSVAAYTLPLTLSVTPTECTPEVILSELITPPTISTIIDNSAQTIQFPLVNDPAKALIYSVSVAARIDAIVKVTETFTLTVYNCEISTTDQSNSTSIEVNFGDNPVIIDIPKLGSDYCKGFTVAMTLDG